MKTKKLTQREIAELAAKYRLVVNYAPEDRCYVVSVPELKGCSSHGRSEAQAVKHAREAIHLYIETLLDRGLTIPAPLADRRFSGKIPLRISPNLHRDLAVKADAEETSLNRFIERRLKKIV
jgi:predicted RNase H-like HicB family nuclease